VHTRDVVIFYLQPTGHVVAHAHCVLYVYTDRPEATKFMVTRVKDECVSVVSRPYPKGRRPRVPKFFGTLQYDKQQPNFAQ